MSRAYNSDNNSGNEADSDGESTSAVARTGSPFLYLEQTGTGNFGTYDECYADFKDKVAKVGTTWVILPVKAGDPFKIVSCQKFTEMHATKNYSKPGKNPDEFVNKQFIKDFMIEGKLEGDRVFSGGFGMYPEPRDCPADEFNLWTPFAVEAITAEGDSEQRIDDLAFLLRHLFILSGRVRVSTRTNPPCPIVRSKWTVVQTSPRRCCTTTCSIGRGSSFSTPTSSRTCCASSATMAAASRLSLAIPKTVSG